MENIISEGKSSNLMAPPLWQRGSVKLQFHPPSFRFHLCPVHSNNRRKKNNVKLAVNFDVWKTKKVTDNFDFLVEI